MKVMALLFSGLMMLPLATKAELNVIADLGGEDVSPYFEAVNKQPGMSQSPRVAQPPVRQGLSAMLPVSTPEMSPGMVENRALKLPGIGALFLIGDDELSRQWLTDNADALKAKHAAGMVVNVDSVSDVNALRELVPGVPLSPASGSELARRLQLQHYPVLITDDGLSQDVSP